MALDYGPALTQFHQGNLTGATLLTYTTPLGTFFYFIILFATIAMVYIKTQSVAITAMASILLYLAMRAYVMFVGETVFFLTAVLCLTVLMFKLWKG